MNLCAYMGEQVPAILSKSKRGMLYSVHNNYLYCLMGQRAIILVHDSSLGSIPFGLSVKKLSSVLSSCCLLNGMIVGYCGALLEILEADVQLSLREAPVREKISKNMLFRGSILSTVARLERILREKSGSVSLARLSPYQDDLVRICLDEDGCGDGSNPFYREAFRRLALLIKAIREQNYVKIKSITCSLIGLGVGLTPSMDDVLVGLISAFHYGRMILGYKSRIMHLLTQSVLESRDKTNPVSWSYLRSAVQGGRFSLIDDVIEALLFLPECDIEEPVNKLLSVGSTSGSEMLLGIALGMNLMFDDNTVGVGLYA